MGSQLALKSRIASTSSLEKIFNAQEMIASSHIAKARDVALNAKPYSDAISDAVQALVQHTHIDHPIVKKSENGTRVAVLALTSDRGMAGPYTSSIIRETDRCWPASTSRASRRNCTCMVVVECRTTSIATAISQVLGKAIPTSPALKSPKRSRRHWSTRT